MSTSRSGNELRRISRRWLVAGVLSFVIITALLHTRQSLLAPATGEIFGIPHGIPSSEEATTSTLELAALNYPYATETFRENLRNDRHYITAFATGGFTNEFLDYVHLLYLAFLTERIPVMPPFVPHEHISYGTPPLRFTSIFNVTLFQNILRRPVIDWEDVKVQTTSSASNREYTYTNNHTESIGCWSTRARHEPEPAHPDNTLRLLGLDASYTRVPDFAYLNRGSRDSAEVTFHGLAATIAPKHPYDTGSLPLLATSPSGSKLPPDSHMVCYDFLYYATSGVEGLEWRYSWSPEWRIVARNIPFTREFVDLATAYLRKIFATEIEESGSDDLPPIITVHIRRGDFAQQCFGEKPCRTGTEKFAQAVEDVKRQLAEERGLTVTSVFIASDEQDPAFWGEVTGLGWKSFNHTAERTSERYNEWYPPLIDTVALSFGAGFVGTLDSTFSTLSAKRVEDWNDGFSKLVHRHL